MDNHYIAKWLWSQMLYFQQQQQTWISNPWMIDITITNYHPLLSCSAKHNFDLKISREIGKLRIRLGFSFFLSPKAFRFQCSLKGFQLCTSISDGIVEFVRTIWISCDILHGFTSEWFWKQLISFFHCIAWTFLWIIYNQKSVWKYNCFFKYLLVKEFECTFVAKYTIFIKTIFSSSKSVL